MSDGGPVLVTGATGNQGGAVARRLLESGRSVRALTRDPAKPAARALEESGAELAEGDLDDRGSLDRALQGAEAVFSVQNFWEAGAEREMKQGKALADAAAEAGVQHFVYSSVGGAERDSGVSHFESKFEIERHIGSLGLPATILRPVFLMENLNSPIYRGALGNGVLPLALDPNRKLQMIACEDVGAYAAMALERSDEFVGEALEIAGDEVTPSEAAAAFSDALGREVKHVQLPIERLKELNPEVAEMFEWFQDAGYAADLERLSEIHPRPLGLRDWIDKDWEGPAS
jgi:uncharacterized protein YbjT (DUF2867 family)